jgi:hypothetical protein
MAYQNAIPHGSSKANFNALVLQGLTSRSEQSLAYQNSQFHKVHV